ncbi:MAG: hypothetical protein IPF59_11045 [Ignavibacteria bacterium]|nr:hypothetical protein [Ignavibacteria bacterium]MBK6417810.1 hypothetical protein [Ignavibacteria bacterium]
MLKIIISIVVVAALIIGIVYAWGYYRWATRTESLRSKLYGTMQSPIPATYDPHELDSLPSCVQRYLRLVLVPGQPIIREVYLEHEGEMDMSQDKWVPFTSKQYISTREPGFIWDARIAMFPGIKAHVHDAFVDGKGLLHASVIGLITMMEQSGSAFDYGEYLRWCAESAWYPTVLLPSQGALWQPLTDTSARVTFKSGSFTATLTVTFSPDGLMSTIRAEDRGREVNSQTIPTPWEGRWSNYIRMNGMLVPGTGEVAWILEEGRKVYWKGRIANSE